LVVEEFLRTHVSMIIMGKKLETILYFNL